MKKIYIITGLIISLLFYTPVLFAQITMQGTVTDRDGNPIENVSIKIQDFDIGRTMDNGSFKVAVTQLPVEIKFSHVRFHTATVLLDKTDNNRIVLESLDRVLEEVEINTGYYRQPKERVTGSFTVLDREMLELSADNNILNRLEGLSNGLYFDKRSVVGEEQGGDPNIRIRGLSTIEGSTAPLIVVDDFPFYGDINDINPNDIENVTILRDAAASSIWGAQAGNGVIVITTKKAKYNSDVQVGYGTNLSLGQKPDLFYDQNYLPSEMLMAVEKELFERNSYAENDRTRLPAYVELLIAKRDGKISEEQFLQTEAFYQQNDLREDYLAHLYQVPKSQRHSLYLNKGGETMTMGFSLNTDNNLQAIKGNENSRLNLGLQLSAKLLPNLEMQSAVWYAKQSRQNNGEGYSRSNGRYIYESLFDMDGNPAHVGILGGRFAYYEQAPEQGLLDWMYRPIEEVGLQDNRQEKVDWRVTQQLRYRIVEGLEVLANYQYVEGRAKNEILYNKDSYQVRNLVNRFTQPDGQRIIPYGAIFESNDKHFSDYHAGRLQLNFNRDIRDNQWFSGLIGGEINQNTILLEPNLTRYNFDEESWVSDLAFDYITRYPTRPSGTSTVSLGTSNRNRTRNRNISYFSNFGYGLDGKYTASASFRWDGSNLLGVKINDKGTLLWSAGIGWDMMKESFMKTEWIQSLKWRITYGAAGNIDKSQSHYPTIRLGNNTVSNLPMATLTHPGNPSLSWEKVNTLNIALDWSMLNGIVHGTADYYIKNSSNLLGNMMVDPSTGVGTNYKVNYADLRTTGLDFQVNTRANFAHRLSWNTTTIINLADNNVKSFYGGNYYVGDYFADPAAVVEDRSIDQLYAFPWIGLDGKNGMPLINIDGELTSDESKYARYYSEYPIDDLIHAGLSVPRVFGSVLNTFSYRSFSLSMLVSFRMGHVFRRKSMGPGQEYVVNNPNFHTDYVKRWKQPGDERLTDVPAWSETNAPQQRFLVYQQSMALIEPADVVRLDNIQLAYNWNSRWFKRLRVYGQCSNLGIIWRANKLKLDPDYINAFYPPSRLFTCGIQIDY